MACLVETQWPCSLGVPVGREREPVAHPCPHSELTVPLPEDRCAYCCVMYGSNPEYLLLALVLARRVAILGDRHPLLILPTPDVPTPFLEALRRAGCYILGTTEYQWMHPMLLRSPKGRHSPVLTKLRCLGLAGLKKVALLDLDLLPRRRLDALFEFRAPAAMLMPANLFYAEPLAGAAEVPREWLEVSWRTGAGGRVNAGVCVLEPDPSLLEYITQQVSPARCLQALDGHSDVVGDVFGAPWRQSWTPEEDALTRGFLQRYPEGHWTHLGAAWNYEVQGDLEYYPEMPLSKEHSLLDLDRDVAVLHFSGSRKPSWYAWGVGRGEFSIAEVCEWVSEAHAADDPKGIVSAATREWLEAFQELSAHAHASWGLDVLELVGWAAPPRAPSSQGATRDRSRSRGEVEAKGEESGGSAGSGD